MTKTEMPMMKVGEVAREIGVSSETIRNWVKRGLVRAYKTPSGQLRFKREDIDTYIERVGAA